MELTEALGVLKAFSFVTEDNNGSYDMHRLVQLVTRKGLANCGTVSRFEKKALLMLSHLYPVGTYEIRMTCGAYLSHANAVLQSCKFRSEEEAEAKTSLLHCMAGYFTFEGKSSDAEALHIEATRIRRELFGEGNPSTLESMANLASTFRKQSQWKEAESLELKVMETTQRVLGEEYPSTLTSMANLAFTLHAQDRFEEAVGLMHTCVSLRQRILGSAHPYTKSSVETLKLWEQEDSTA
ncbi:hypothetical protein S40285_09561 [Stachybotrys chlorohalonatus IBT 40285]|uniref:MalT-like TPR region domain-containing protein n=1 Tax=Stachybotrys chlorohalonatus (strain IBT 40285) TaxID=1283841 RepID=A0A084QLM0_STAC4|nr:hypothetical protein S40285_09561 [Stachybotrys chlorohalonata IBT 40285]